MSTPAIFNNAAIQAAGGQIYLAPTPVTVVGTTTAAIVKELFEKFLVSGDARDALKPDVKHWLIPDNNGLKGKIEMKPIKINPNNGPERTIGWESVGQSAEITFHDADVAHMADLLSALPSQILTTVASATQAGRSTLLGGGQRNPNRYMLLYRYPSAEVPGEFMHKLLLSVTLTPDGDSELNKSKAKAQKVKVDAEPFDLLVDPATGFGVVWLEDQVTAPKI